jgi:hypothetical protein
VDLRNLIGDKNESFKPFRSLTKKEKDLKKNIGNMTSQSAAISAKLQSAPLKVDKDEEVPQNQRQQLNSSKPLPFFTLPSLSSSSSSSIQQPIKQKYQSLVANMDAGKKLDRLLVHLFGTSRSANAELIKERIRNSSNPEKLIRKFERYTMALLNNPNFAQHYSKLMVNQTTTNNQVTISSPTSMTIPSTTASIGPSIGPSLYKLNINDSFSKKIIDNPEFRHKFGLRPNEKLNLLLLKKPNNDEGQQNIELLVNNQNLNRNINVSLSSSNETLLNTTSSTTTDR